MAVVAADAVVDDTAEVGHAGEEDCAYSTAVVRTNSADIAAAAAAVDCSIVAVVAEEVERSRKGTARRMAVVTDTADSANKVVAATQMVSRRPRIVPVSHEHT